MRKWKMHLLPLFSLSTCESRCSSVISWNWMRIEVQWGRVSSCLLQTRTSEFKWKPLCMYIGDADVDKMNWMSEAMVNRVPNTLSFTVTFFCIPMHCFSYHRFIFSLPFPIGREQTQWLTVQIIFKWNRKKKNHSVKSTLLLHDALGAIVRKTSENVNSNRIRNVIGKCVVTTTTTSRGKASEQ